ncbi:unnamed protein product [Mycena citricolor]|uniref:Uncharacterized protein n=1 Tax=Mycena citricolor TaxID=2018698 RepID=A0AAD2HSI6_9AGAR|nr:unnamed protein product [Mycena citricolor]
MSSNVEYPSRIQPTSILTLLHYISPTPQPLPPHLVASELALRHSYLNIATDDPSYLIWPGADDEDERAKTALEHFQRLPLIDDLENFDFEIRYTGGPSVSAHVQVGGDLRLVFQWEGAWKYMNAAPMPFPTESLNDVPPPQSGDDVDGDDDVPEAPESYWGAYEATLPDGDDGVVKEMEGAADSYWDMYNAVHGSGDSEIPSPAPEKTRRPEQPFAYTYAEMHPPTDPMESLADRLEILANRQPSTPDEDTITVVDRTGPGVSGIDALRDSIRGSWKLFTARSDATSSDHDIFLRIVQEVLAET